MSSAAQHRLDARLHEHVEERELRRLVRRLEVGPVLHRRERDQVHLAVRQRLQATHQLLRARARVVQALHERVFEGDHAPRRARVGAACRQQLVERPAPVDGHELRAERVVRRVERHGKLELEALGRELREARHDAAGGERDVARAEVGALPRVEELQRAQRRVVVRERLAHAHHDEVREAEARALAAVFGRREEALRRHDLGDDLVRRERPHEAPAAARAERAAHRAADLGGDTLREAALRGDDDGLDGLAVGEAEEELRRAVGGAVRRAHGGDDEGELALERFAEVLRQRRRRIPVLDPVAVERLEDLVGAEGAQAARNEDRLPLVGEDGPGGRHFLSIPFKISSMRSSTSACTASPLTPRRSTALSNCA